MRLCDPVCLFVCLFDMFIRIEKGWRRSYFSLGAYGIFFYGAASGNGRRAFRIYKERFPNRNHPHHTMLARVYQRLREDGSLRPRCIGGRSRQTRTPARERGPVAWPARSPDLTPLEFFLWVHVKCVVYVNPANTRQELNERIFTACDQIRHSPSKFARVRQVMARRRKECNQVQGTHFEHLL